ncbi:hypothetical protein [Streptomyces sp. NPDC058653]|uniref:hypothetical protein n=1 Tax=Streptomyces sp. NPDC058653 TaxID=3346576 RepID=UPI00364F7D54
MKTRHATAAAAATAVLLLALTACGGTETDPDKATETAAAPEAAPEPVDDTVDVEEAVEDTAPAETAQLPDLTGETLQAAQDTAQASGFYGLTSSDATGADRMQILDRGWQVCSQTPAPGEHPTDTIIDFSTVKTEETCP